MRAVVEVVFGRAGLHVAGRGEESRALGCRHGLVEILLHIGPDVQLATGHEHAAGMDEKGVGEHAPLAMAGFPPWVGEIDVDGSQAGVGQQTAGKVGGITVDDPGIGGPLGGELAAAEPRIAATDFHAQEIQVGPCGRGRGEKQPLAAAHLHLDGRLPRKQALGIERRGQCRQFEQVTGQVERRIRLAGWAAGHGSVRWPGGQK